MPQQINSHPLVIVVMEFIKVVSKIDSVKEILKPNENKQQIKSSKLLLL
jgi:hypothetical protein